MIGMTIKVPEAPHPQGHASSAAHRMPLRKTLLALCLFAAQAQAAPTPPQPSALDAPLFYQLLIGELEAQRGELGTAYQVLLDAARRTGDEGLYRRVIALALQARAGTEAYAGARAWRQQTGSLAAQQHVVQLAVALGRLEEAGEPLIDWMEQLGDSAQRAGLLTALPQLLRNVNERERPLNAMEPRLAEIRDAHEASKPRRQLAACLIAALALHADNEALALNQLRQADRELPQDALPAWMALDLMRRNPDAEAIVPPRLAGNIPLHTAYARALSRDQRTLEALEQFEALVRLEPEQPAHRYALAMLQLDIRQPQAALSNAELYLAALPEAGHDEQRALAQLLKVQALTQLQRWDAALALLDAMPAGTRDADLVFRRASIEARQGQLAKARERLRALPRESSEQAERALLLEVQVLRDANQWSAAHQVLEEALRDDPTDTDLLYEHALSAERLGRFDLMEQQLRRVLELNPRHHHAMNALGYSLADRNTRLAEARELIERAMALGGHEPAVIDSLGWVAFREGRLDEAERWLRRAHRARPDAEIAAHLAELLYSQGKSDEARQLAREAQSREPENAVLKALRKRLGL